MKRLTDCEGRECSFGYGPMESVWLGRGARDRSGLERERGWCSSGNIAISKLAMADVLRGVACVRESKGPDLRVDFTNYAATRVPEMGIDPTVLKFTHCSDAGLPAVLLVREQFESDGHMTCIILHRESTPPYVEYFDSSGDPQYVHAGPAVAAMLNVPFVDYSCPLQGASYRDSRFNYSREDEFCQTWAMAWPIWRLKYGIDPIVLRNALVSMDPAERTQMISQFNRSLLFHRELPLPPGLYERRETRVRFSNPTVHLRYE